MVWSGYVLNVSNGKLEDEVTKERRLWDFEVGVNAKDNQTDKYQSSRMFIIVVYCKNLISPLKENFSE